MFRMSATKQTPFCCENSFVCVIERKKKDLSEVTYDNYQETGHYEKRSLYPQKRGERTGPLEISLLLAVRKANGDQLNLNLGFFILFIEEKTYVCFEDQRVRNTKPGDSVWELHNQLLAAQIKNTINAAIRMWRWKWLRCKISATEKEYDFQNRCHLLETFSSKKKGRLSFHY